MVNKLSLTKDLNDLRIKAANLFNDFQQKGTSDAAFNECLLDINSLKVKIENLKDQS